MNQKHQRIVMAVAGAACAAIWAPQLLSRSGKASTSAQVDVGPSAEEMAAMTAGLEAAPPAGNPESATVARASKPDLSPRPGEDARRGLGELLAGLQNFGATSKPRSLDEVATDWARARSRTAATAPTEGLVAGPVVGPETADALEAYLAEHPFRGTLVFADDAVALFGPHALRVGDELLGGDAVIARIEGQRVTVSHRGIPRDVSLPPMRAEQAASNTNGPAPQRAGGARASSSDSSSVPAGQQDLNPSVVAPVPGGNN